MDALEKQNGGPLPEPRRARSTTQVCLKETTGGEFIGYIGLLEGFYTVCRPSIRPYNGNYPPEMP